MQNERNLDKLKIDNSAEVKQISSKVLLTCALFFFLPSANSYPGRAYYFLTNLQGYIGLSFENQSLINLLLLPTIIISTLIIVIRLAAQEQIFTHVSRYSLCLLIGLFIFFIGGTLSMFANYQTPGVLTNYISSILSPLLIALAFMNSRFNYVQLRMIFIAFALGCLFPLVLGLYAYYLSWGIPDLTTLILSHFNLKKMSQYSIQTFGNADNTAVFMGMVGVTFFCLLLDYKKQKMHSLFLMVVFLLAVIHLSILQARTEIIWFLIITLLISLLRNRWIFLSYLIILFGICLGAYIFSSKSLDIFFNRMMLALTWSNQGQDISAGARLAAMQMGWKVFMQNFLLGVGPGASLYYISYSSAHQFNIQQGVELGILGFVGSIFITALALWQFFTILRLHYFHKLDMTKLALVAAPAFYFFCAIFANVPLSIGVVNTWFCLAIAMLFLSDCSIL